MEQLVPEGAPDPKEKLLKIWSLILEAFTGQDAPDRVEEVFEVQYVAARGSQLLLKEGPNRNQVNAEGQENETANEPDQLAVQAPASSSGKGPLSKQQRSQVEQVSRPVCFTAARQAAAKSIWGRHPKVLTWLH